MKEKMRMGVSALIASSIVGGGAGLANLCASQRELKAMAGKFCDNVTRVLADRYELYEEKLGGKGSLRDLNARVKSGMVFLSNDCKNTFCTGFIYDENTIVSCGHCLEGYVYSSNSLCVHFVGAEKDGGEAPGWTLVDTDKFVTAKVEDYEINLVKYHPDADFYTRDVWYNDFGVMKVKENLLEVSGGGGVALPVRDGKHGLDAVRVILSSRSNHEGDGVRKLRDFTFAFDFDKGLRLDGYLVGGDSGTPVTDFDGNVVGLGCYVALPTYVLGNPMFSNSDIKYLKEHGGVRGGNTIMIDIENRE